MSTKPQDAATQTAASTAAQNASSTQSANAATAQNNANNMTSTLFGTYNPTTNQYAGGTESAALNPASLTSTGLTGSYANAYNTEANASAENAKNAVGTTMQNLASRGLGATPNGFAADQERQAYQTQAQNNATNYSGLFGTQQNQAETNYANANSLLSGSANQNQNSATANNSGAAGTNTSLYGTASTPVPTALGTALSTVTGLAGGAAGAAGINKICWVAAELYGGWYEPRTILVREWLTMKFAKCWIGSLILKLYVRHGEAMAKRIRTSPLLRMIFTPIFNLALRQARKAQ